MRQICFHFLKIEVRAATKKMFNFISDSLAEFFSNLSDSLPNGIKPSVTDRRGFRK